MFRAAWVLEGVIMVGKMMLIEIFFFKKFVTEGKKLIFSKFILVDMPNTIIEFDGASLSM